MSKYDDNILEALVKGVKSRSELKERIKTAIEKLPELKGKKPENIEHALKRRGLLKSIKVDTVGVATSWPEEKKDNFRKDCLDAGKTLGDLIAKYELKNENQLRNIVRSLKAKMADRRRGRSRGRSHSNKVINKKILELVESGILLDDDGLNNLHTSLCEEFSDCKFDKRSFKKRIERLIWKQRALDKTLQEVVRDVMRNELKAELNIKKVLENFKIAYNYIPDDMIEKKAKWHSGLMGGFAKKLIRGRIPGINRVHLDDYDPNFKIPRATFDKPVVVDTDGDPENWPIMFLNGANIGLRYPRDIVGNVPRMALSNADAFKDECIILTNFLNLDLKKAGGPAKTARAQIFGDNINLDLIQDERYKEIVEQIIKDDPMDKIIYRTSNELVNDLLGAYRKIFTKPNYTLEYNGPVYVVIGMNELAVIFTIAYWEIKWWTTKEQKRLDSRIKLTKKAIAEVEKKLKKDDRNATLYQEMRDLIEELDSLQYQRAITVISNVATRESQRFFNYAYNLVVKKIEKAIPNSKVIGEGSTWFEVNGRKINVHIPSHVRVSENLLNDWANKYGPGILRGHRADPVVICHPTPLQFRVTGREADHDGDRDFMNVFVAPMAIDDRFLREEFSSLRGKDHPVMRAVYTETAKTGVLRVRCTNGVISAEEISVGALESFKDYPRSRINKKMKGTILYRRSSPNIWFMLASDQHWGGRSKEFVWDAKNKIRLSMAEAVFEMMRREGLFEGNKMPIHFFLSPDDPTQGQNHKYRTEPHPKQMSYRLIETVSGSILEKARKSGRARRVLEDMEEMRKLFLFQLEKRGDDYPFTQMLQMMKRHIEPNVDFFIAVLKRALSANIQIEGVGDHVLKEYGSYDTRNIGFINIGTGDRHFSKTLDFEMIEGPLYAQRLRDLIAQHNDWKSKKELLEKLVVSPIYGQTCNGWGIISVKGKHKYGLEVRSAPTNMAGWGDTLKGHVARDLRRGNYSKFWEGKTPIIKFFGDKHFYDGVSTSHAIYHMSPASLHTDAYGEFGGFPPNNTGVSFLGIPADGPDSGPIFWKVLPFNVIKDFLEDNPRPFNWEEYLPNPA